MATNYIPTFEIFKGGENITARFQDRALSITVRLAAGSGDQDSVEIVLDDRGWQIASPQVGDRLTVNLGYTGVGTAFMGSFEINKVRYRFPAKQISVIGTAASSLSELKSQKVTQYEGKTVEQVLAEFGSKIGMRVDVHREIADEKLPFLNNIGSFQGLVAKLESRYNAIAKFTDGRLSLVPRGEGKSVSDFAMPTYVLRPEHLADVEVLVDSAPAFKATKARWRDKKTHELKEVQAPTKLGNNQSSAEYSINGREFPSESEAQAAANATQAQLDRATGKIFGTLASGDPWFRDGQRVLITSSRPGIDGSYLIDLVQHSYSKEAGLRTSFSGTAGDEGLPASYSSGSNAGDFLTLDPTMFTFGQALQQPSMTLNQQNSSTPSLVGQPPPTP
ncbi:phage late control D family protein [Methylobacterium symbioticum]|uniref:Phage late control D family protein n=1 Tax=Methylobacterium symbioticum TaxID=2584084 RepID=A0A509EA56_9HYPH|nr:hypothetical protein [Methylobacterium symbioticum]VUD70033.1 hypothetical protein MET9862_00594 [Methylobacterium symbioticum]